MSLKAKIEAVIYAAEEPVTLAQLAALFLPEVMEERAARLEAEAAASEAESQPMPEGEVELTPVEPAEEAAQPQTLETVVESSVAETSIEDEKKAARQRDKDARDEVRRILDGLMADYAKGDRGMEVREIAGGYRVSTKPEYHDAVRGFVKSLKPPMKLSLQALETLAVIAYKQPVTAPEVSEIRGVDSGGVLGSLIARKLVTTAGRKQVIGRPILYKTTKEFLLRFGLKDVNELPSIEEFEKMAGELAEEPETAAESAELPFESEVIESEESEEAKAIRAHDDAVAAAAAVAAVAVSDEGAASEFEDLPGVAVKIVHEHEHETEHGQPVEGD
jgi:segregation and condensation protein B